MGRHGRRGAGPVEDERHRRRGRPGAAHLRARLTGSLTRQIHREIADSTERINEAIAPYRRFVLTQQQTFNEARDDLVVTEEALKRLRAELQGR